MPRKGPAPKRPLIADPVYGSPVVTQLINKILLDGKKTTAESIVYGALEGAREKTGNDPLSVRLEMQQLGSELDVESARGNFGGEHRLNGCLAYEQQVREIGPAKAESIDRDVEWGAKEESHCRLHCKRINVSHPTPIAATRNVARKRRVDITIGEHDRACFQRRNDVALGAVGKIGGVQQRKRRGREQVTFLGAFCRILNERR